MILEEKLIRFVGVNNMEFIQGVVEDNNDPRGNARVKVRIDGYHTTMDESGESFGIPTEDLDWYPVLMPTTSSSRGGRGQSPSGLMIGDRVALLVLDTVFKQSAIVIGTIHGDGDTSNISVGGIEALDSDAIVDDNNNRTKAPRLNSKEYDRDAMEVDDVGFDLFYRSLVFEEGFVNKPYYDQFKYPHIGIGTLLKKQRYYSLTESWKLVEQRLGRKIPEKRISEEEAKRLATEEINKIKGEINRFPLLSSVYNTVSQTRKYALISMCYQMGTAGVSKFTTSLSLMLQEEWSEVYKNLLKSKWAKQTPKRAMRISSVLRDNNFGSYPIKQSSGGSTKMRRSFNASGTGIQYDDVTDIQYQLVESTKPIRSVTNVQSIEDVKTLYDFVINFDVFIGNLKDLMNNVIDNVKSLRDIDVMDWIQRYLNRVREFMLGLVKKVKDFIVSAINDTVEAIKAIADLIEQLIKRIIFNMTSIGSDIDAMVERVIATFHEESDEESEEESGVMFAEPPSEFAGEYPMVKTTISESGHIMQVDDTPGFERISERHRTGTYREVNADGRIVEKSVSDKITIVSNDDHIYIEGTGKVSIGGSHIINIVGDSVQVINGDVKQVVRGDSYTETAGDSTVLTMGDAKVEVRGNMNSLIEGNFIGEVKGNANLTVEGKTDAIFQGDTKVFCGSNLEAIVEGDATLSISGNLKSYVDGRWDMNVGGGVKIKSGGDMELYAPKIWMDA